LIQTIWPLVPAPLEQTVLNARKWPYNVRWPPARTLPVVLSSAAAGQSVESGWGRDCRRSAPPVFATAFSPLERGVSSSLLSVSVVLSPI